MSRFIARLKYRLFVVSERLRAAVRIPAGSTFPRLYLPQHRRAAIQIATAVISYAGAALALFSLPRPLNIGVAIAMLILERTLNGIIYRFQTLFVPRPIEQDLEDVGFDHLVVATVDDPPGHPPVLFLGFSSCVESTVLFETFAEWCGMPAAGTIDDREPGRIGFSVVFEGTDTYRVFIYRTLTAPAGGRTTSQERDSPGVDELVQVNVIRTRHFPVAGQAPAIYEAQRLLGNGGEYFLAATSVADGAVKPCPNSPQYLKQGFKVKARYQLTRQADPVEYAFYLIRDARL